MGARRGDNFWAALGRYSSLAFLLPASTFAGYLVGHLLDSYLGTSFLRIVCLLLGTAGGFIELFRQLLKNNEPHSR